MVLMHSGRFAARYPFTCPFVCYSGCRYSADTSSERQAGALVIRDCKSVEKEKDQKMSALVTADKPGGGSFVCGLRWLSRHSPLRGYAVAPE